MAAIHPYAAATGGCYIDVMQMLRHVVVFGYEDSRIVSGTPLNLWRMCDGGREVRSGCD